ncbi:Yip1 family protein [Aliidiomarina sp. Khilg15.8]
MILNHIWGLYAHPVDEWKTIDQRHESLRFSLSHILIVALIPCAFAYYAAAHAGFSIGARELIYLTEQSAITLAVVMYVGIVLGVMALAYLIHSMAKVFGADPSYTQALELAAYTATPVLMSGIAALYPELWFVSMAFLAGVAYSVYLLYAGVPILMHIPEERGFMYSSSVVTAGLVLMVILMVVTAMAWTNGFAPTYMS